jgi:hypothetical protein
MNVNTFDRYTLSCTGQCDLPILPYRRPVYDSLLFSSGQDWENDARPRLQVLFSWLFKFYFHLFDSPVREINSAILQRLPV